MYKINSNNLPVIVAMAAIAATLVLLPLVSFAQQGSGSGSSNGSGQSTQDRDQDRIQDPTTHDGDEPDQDRDQMRDQDRIQDPTVSNGVPDQDRDRTQDRDRIQDPTVGDGTPDQDRDQDRDRDRIHVDSPEALKNYIAEQRSAATSVAGNMMANGMQERNQERNQVQVAVNALLASEDLVGPLGPQISGIAAQIGSSTQAMMQVEERTQTRSWLRGLFFGGDRVAAETVRNQVQTNNERIQMIRQQLNDSSATAEVRAMLEEQLRNMEVEQERLRQFANEEDNTWGIFSWRF